MDTFDLLKRRVKVFDIKRLHEKFISSYIQVGGQDWWIMGNWVLGVCVCWCQGAESARVQPPCVLVCRCECTVRNSAAGWVFSARETYFFLASTSWSEEDKCENARRNPGRGERVLIKNSARENRRYYPFGGLVAAPRINSTSNGLKRCWMGWNEADFFPPKDSKSRKKKKSKRSKPRRKGE